MVVAVKVRVDLLEGGMAAEPWDLYREVHKGMRLAVASVTTQAGSADAGDERSVRTLLHEWRDVSFVLRGHHDHEDEFCDPLVRRHAPQLRDELEEGHRLIDHQLAALQTGRWTESGPPGRSTGPGSSLGFHLDLADLAACYLPHLALRRALRDACPQCCAQRSGPRGGHGPDQEQRASAGHVLVHPLHGPGDGLRRAPRHARRHVAGAPPEIFELFRATAHAALPPQEYEAVALAAGFA